MDKIRVVVVDDEKPARSRISELLEKQPDCEVVGVANDGLEAVQLIQDKCPDLLFLDIQMPGMDGFDVLKHLHGDHVPLTIFVSGYDKYAIPAFEAHALDYLLKPFSDERLEAALQRARNHLAERTNFGAEPRDSRPAKIETEGNEESRYFERIVIKSGGRVIFLDVADIDWIEAAGVYVYLHVGSKSHLYRATIGHLQERLDPQQFVRVHRSTIVNTDRIAELQPRTHGDYVLFLRGGTELTLSRGYRAELEGWLRQPL